MVNINKDFMDGFIVAFALIDITSDTNAQRQSPEPTRTKAALFNTALKAFEAADKKLIDPNELKEALENIYDIKFQEVK